MKHLHLMRYYLVYLFIGIAMGLSIPLLSVYLQDELSFSGTQVGTILAATALFQIIALPIWGLVTDKIKSAKKSLVISVFLSAIFVTFQAFTNDYNIYLMVVILFIIARSPIFALYDDILLTVAHKYNTSYGQIRSLCSFGFAIATFIGYFFAGIFGFNSIFILAGILFALSFLILLTSEDIEYKSDNKIHIKTDVPMLLKNKSFIVISFVMVFLLGIVNTNISFVSSYMSVLNATESQISLAIFISAIIELPLLWTVKHIYKHLNLSYIVIILCIINILKYSMMFIFSNILVIFIFAPIHGITYALSYPIAIEYIKVKVPKKVLATSFALHGAAVALGQTIFTYAAGYLFDITADVRVYFILFGILSIVPLLFIKNIKNNDYNSFKDYKLEE